MKQMKNEGGYGVPAETLRWRHVLERELPFCSYAECAVVSKNFLYKVKQNFVDELLGLEGISDIEAYFSKEGPNGTEETVDA